MAVLAPETIQAAFQAPRNDGGFDGQTRVLLRRLGRQRPVVMLAFPPKAAGTYFRMAVKEVIGNAELIRAVHAQGGRDAQLYLPTFLAYYSGGTADPIFIAHVHMQALPANVRFLEGFDIRPIIMVRAIPDMLASYWDMLENDPASRKEGLNCRIPENFPDLPAEAKADFMIDILGPWYASYFATWMDYAKSDPDRVCVLHYRDFKADPANALEEALEHAGVPYTYEDCQAGLDRAWEKRDDLRYNKGKRGRGETYFSPAHIARLERMLGHYAILAPHMDELLGRGAFAAAKAA